MKNFLSIKLKSFSFSSCEGCGAKCCSGLYGSNFSELTLEEFSSVHELFPILFTFGDLGFLKANLIISQGIEPCKHIKNNLCTIYEKRPYVCRTYPLSPSITNNVHLDISCPALIKGEEMIKRGELNPEFHHEIFDNYQDKFLATHYYLEDFNKKEDFEVALNIKGMDFYKYKKKTQDKYFLMHQKSLKLL